MDGIVLTLWPSKEQIGFVRIGGMIDKIKEDIVSMHDI
jgi:hypothetical protein